MKLLVIAFATLYVCNAQSVTDCSSLGLGTRGPPFMLPASDSVCTDLSTTSQCCTADNLTKASETAENSLKRALREELEDNRETYEEFVRDLDRYFSGSFVQDLSERFSISSSIPADVMGDINDFVNTTLIPNLAITTGSTSFNVDTFVSDLFSELSQSFSFTITSESDIIICIQRVLSQNINGKVRTLIDSSIEVVRQSYSILLRVREFLMDLQDPEFTPVRGCVERLARLSFCGRCTQQIPPLCQGTCNNLIRGCLSPLYTAYQNDFRQIWQYVENILTNLKSRLSELFSEEGNLLASVDILLGEIQTECLEDIPDSPIFRKKRSAEDSEDSSESDDSDSDDEMETAFDELFEDLRELDGFFEYDSDGPEFCEPEDDEEEYCDNQNRDLNDLRPCAVNEICVSECNCWDGAETRTQDTPTVTVGNSVEDQATNPTVEGLISELQDQAIMLEKNSPARAFLESEEIAELNPMGVVIPGNGAVTMIVSVTAMTLAVIVVLAI